MRGRFWGPVVHVPLGGGTSVPTPSEASGRVQVYNARVQVYKGTGHTLIHKEIRKAPDVR